MRNGFSRELTAFFGEAVFLQAAVRLFGDGALDEPLHQKKVEVVSLKCLPMLDPSDCLDFRTFEWRMRSRNKNAPNPSLDLSGDLSGDFTCDWWRTGLCGMDFLQIRRREGEFGPEAGGLEGEAGLGGFRFAAGGEDALDAAAPGLDFSRAEKDMRDGGIVRGGGMRAEEFFKSPPFGNGAGVPNGEAVGVDADLHGGGDGVIAMDEGVEDGFAQGGIGHGVAFDALDAAVGDGGFEILGLQEVDGAGGEGEEIAMEGVVVGQIGLGTEVADFHEGAGNEFLRILVEEQHGGAFEVGAFGELEFFNEGGFGGAHVLRSDATGSAGETAEPADRAAREIQGPGL